MRPNLLRSFREGNGRTQREFIRQLAMQNNLYLSYVGITQDELIETSITSFRLDYAQMERIILGHLKVF